MARRLNAAVAKRVRLLKKPGEAIWHWTESKPGEVEVLLGPPRRRSPDEEFWGASGRSLHFQKVGGRWTLAGRGEWRT